MVGTIRYSAVLQFAEYLGFSRILGFMLIGKIWVSVGLYSHRPLAQAPGNIATLAISAKSRRRRGREDREAEGGGLEGGRGRNEMENCSSFSEGPFVRACVEFVLPCEWSGVSCFFLLNRTLSRRGLRDPIRYPKESGFRPP